MKNNTTSFGIITVIGFFSFLFISCSSINEAEREYQDWKGGQAVPDEFSLVVETEKSFENFRPVLNYSVILTNESDQTMGIAVWTPNFGVPEFNLVLVNSDDQVVWTRYFAGQALRTGNIKLNPGESFAFEETWNLRDRHNQKLPPGTYRLYGRAHSMAYGPIQSIENPEPISESVDLGSPPVTSDPYILEIN